MKKLKHIINWIVWSLLALYLSCLLLVQLPPVQRFLGRQVAAAIASRLGTKVSISRVGLGFFNRLILDDVMIMDQQQEEMLRVGRLSVKMEVLPLMEGRVSVSSAQLFGAHAMLYKADSLSVPNYQFALDSLASNDSTSNSALNLRINSLIIRRSSIAYDERDVAETPAQFNMKHLKIKDISAHVILKSLQEDSLNVNIKRLTLNEQSGLTVDRLSMKVEANRHEARLDDFQLLLPNTTVGIDSLSATYDMARLPESLRFATQVRIPRLVPSDLSCFLPPLKDFDQQLTINATAYSRGNSLEIPSLTIDTDDHSLVLSASGSMNDYDSQPVWAVRMSSLDVAGSLTAQCKQVFDQIPDEVVRLGDIHLEGTASGNYQGRIASSSRIMTGAGRAAVQVDMNTALLSENAPKGIDTRFTLHVDADSFLLGRVIGHEDIGSITTNIDMQGTRDSITANGLVGVVYKNYPYRNIELKTTYAKGAVAGRVRVDDPNLQAEITGQWSAARPSEGHLLSAERGSGKRSKVNISGYVNGLNPRALNWTDKWGNTRFSMALDADFTASDLNDAEGSVAVNDFEMAAPDTLGGVYRLDHVRVMSGFDVNAVHFLNIKGDMGEGDIRGRFDWSTLAQSFVNYIATKLPTLPSLPKTTHSSDNDFVANITLTETEWMERLLDIPVMLEQPLTLHAAIDDMNQQITIEGRLPRFNYKGRPYQDARIDIATRQDTMVYDLCLTRLSSDDATTQLKLTGKAADNNLAASLRWNLQPAVSDGYSDKDYMNGVINTITQLYTNEGGVPEAHVRVLPSMMMVRGTPWRLEPSDILYSDKRLLIDHFSMNHDKQYLMIDGIASESAADAVIVDVNQLEVAYILDLVGFDAVEFEGLATGHAHVSQVFNRFAADADLVVEQFKFEKGSMGTLHAKALWNSMEEQIDIHALADDGPLSQTHINGYVSPVRSDISLDIRAAGSSIEFCKSFTSSFLSDVHGKAYGLLTLAGPLDAINLTGDLVASGQATVTALNTTYTLENDTIYFIPNDIQFRRCPIKDRQQKVAWVTGGLHHDCLTNLTFDIDIEAQDFLAYDFPAFGDDIICGTVYATGTADLHGRPGEVLINCHVTPVGNSTFSYNAANPDAISKQEFITWREKVKVESSQSPDKPTLNFQPTTDLRINFNINAIPQGTLKILMDANTGDWITLNGEGAIKATYYNKGPFQMFGTYTVESGTYGITIQNIIKKNFVFQNGGSIVFGGDPFNATLNLQALYTVNGVSLSDLSLGNSFSNNTVRVNCLMNILGTPGTPLVEFDLQIPTVNAEENQLIRSHIANQQEMNQQVLYLLGVGRFYTQTGNNSQTQEYGQTQLALQSLLSGTLSTQINQVLSQVIKSNHWNFGANISTGNEGWHNAEYEGLVSGSMLNNRLIINGQFGYRDNAAQATTTFIGDFDIRYLLIPNGNLAVKMYNQTNDRYFTRSSLNTQGVGLIIKKDFDHLSELFRHSKKSPLEN